MELLKEILKKKSTQIGIALTVCLVLAGSLLTGVIVARAPKPDVVGYVRIQEVLNKWPSFVKANEEFNEYVKQLQADYEKRLETASDDEKESLLKEMQDKMQKTNDEMVEPFNAILERAIEEAKAHHGLKVILSSDHIIAGGVDITDMVTALVNRYSETTK